MDLINGLELLSWTFWVRFAGTAYAVREDILKDEMVIHQFGTATNFTQIWAGRWKSGPGNEAEVWQCWGLPAHSTGFAAHTSRELFSLCDYVQTLLNTEQIQGVKYQGTPGVLHSLRSHLSNGVHPCSADASELHCITEFCCCRWNYY